MMVRCTDRLSLFAAPATLDSDYDIGVDAYEEVASKIRGTAPFVVMDLPHAWNGWIRRMLAQRRRRGDRRDPGSWPACATPRTSST
jgi:Flp pilus assembly CpaE family ATPase